jgi:hypothetical protein
MMALARTEPLILPRVDGVAAAGPRKGNDALDAILGAGGLDYAYFDFAATDRLYQVYAGLTPADNVHGRYLQSAG